MYLHGKERSSIYLSTWAVGLIFPHWGVYFVITPTPSPSIY